MAINFSKLFEEARLSTRALLDYSENFFHPTVRLGVTGLSRAGKTVFITALVHGLARGGRFPIFESMATGRIAAARLEPQPDDAIPRFDYEDHLRTLIDDRNWPHSTVDISELRLVVDYQRRNGSDRSLTIDIVDYPGEWLLDLALLDKSYATWSREALALFDEAAQRAGGIHAEDRHGVPRFFPCTTLAMGAAHITPGRLRHAEEVANLAALAKHEAKQTATGLVLHSGLASTELNMLAA